jgi:hypothetical protein
VYSKFLDSQPPIETFFADAVLVFLPETRHTTRKTAKFGQKTLVKAPGLWYIDFSEHLAGNFTTGNDGQLLIQRQ